MRYKQCLHDKKYVIRLFVILEMYFYIWTPITKADLMEWGLAGGADSARRRQVLLRRLDLPEHLTANGMLEALNLLVSREELEKLLQTE